MAMTTARKPSTVEIQPCPPPATISAPMMVMPLMALAPDMSGVCRIVGTRLISSTPRKVARVKTTMLASSASMLSPGRDGAGVGQAHRAGDGILGRDPELAVLRRVLDQRLQVPAVHHAGVLGDLARQVDRGEDGDAARHHRLTRAAELAVAAGLRGEVHDHGA